MKTKSIWITGAVVLALGTAGAAMAHGKRGEGHEGKGRGANMEQMFEQMDANADGLITAEEITAAKTKRFADMDANADGFLDAAEIAAHSERANESRAERMISRLDTDKDGKLSTAEAAAFPGQDRMIARLDSNDDGAISKDEAEAAMAKMRGRHGDRAGKGQSDN